MIPSMSELPVHSPTLFLLNSFALSLLQHGDQSQQQQQQQQQQQLNIANLYVPPLHGGSRLADKLIKELPEPTHLLLRRRPGHNI